MAQTASSSASTSIFDDCLDVSPSFSTRTMRLRLHVRLRRHRHPTTTSTTITPRTATSTKAASPNALGYLDIGTKGYHLASASHQQPRQFKLLRRDIFHDVPAPTVGGCQLVLLWFLSSLIVHHVPIVDDATATTTEGMLEYTYGLRID
jgi:hypothetical protein